MTLSIDDLGAPDLPHTWEYDESSQAPLDPRPQSVPSLRSGRRVDHVTGDPDVLITERIRVVAAVSEHADRSEEARKCAGYFTHNRPRMDYPTFESMGLCVGSGVVEAGCKTAVGVRMKRAGMRWSVRGANAIAALRCCRVSGRYDEFWDWRVALNTGRAA